MPSQSDVEAFEADIQLIYDLQLMGLLTPDEAEGYITMSRSYHIERDA